MSQPPLQRRQPHRPWLAAVVALNVSFWLLAPLVTVVFSLLGAAYVTAFALIVHDRRRTQRLIRRSISRYGATVLKCAWPLVRVRYVDHAPDEPPPFVFTSNHRSTSDAFLMACLPFECVQVVNLWPFRIPWLGFMARLAGYLSVREMPLDAYMLAGERLLNDGVSVITFPEGTRSGSRRMGPFTSSVFRLAKSSGARIAPLAISGNQNIPRRGSLVLCPGVIHVHKLPAVMPREYQSLTTFQLKLLVRNRIQQHLDQFESQDC